MTINDRTDFYVAGGTLTGTALSYVAREADSDLYESLMAGELCYVLDTRQVGKSSLLVRAIRRLQDQGRLTCYIDLSTFGDSPTESQWYYKLLDDLARSLNIEQEAEVLWEKLSSLSSAQRWFAAVRDLVLPNLKAPLIVFIDELDSVRKLPFSLDGFFAMIRALYNMRATSPYVEHLTFCMAGVATPSDLITDSRTTPFNIGKRIELRDFTLAESSALDPGLLGNRSEQDQQLKRIHEWTSGHPYLTQRFCQAVRAAGHPLSRSEIDTLCIELFLRRQAQSEEANLHFVRRQILDDPNSGILLGIYQRIRSGKAPITGVSDEFTDHLMLTGLVKIDHSHRPSQVVVRNRIYSSVFGKDWIKASLPDAERRRIRKAVWRGFLRASAIWLILIVLLLFALNRQHKLSILNDKYFQINSKLKTTSSQFDSASDELKHAENAKVTLDKTISDQRQRTNSLRSIEIKLKSENRAAHQLLERTQITQKLTTQTLRTLESQEASIRTTSETALAMMGSQTSGQEFEALAHGLKAVQPMVAAHKQPTPQAVNALEHAVTAGVYRCLQLHHDSAVYTAEFSGNDEIIVTAGRSSYISFWNAQTGALLCKSKVFSETMRDPEVWTASFSPDNRYLVTAGNDGFTRVWVGWPLRSKLRLVSVFPNANPGEYHVAAFSSNGKYIAASFHDHTSNETRFGVMVAPMLPNGVVDTARSVKMYHDGEVRSCAFNNTSIHNDHNDQYLIVAGLYSVGFFEYRSGMPIYTWTTPDAKPRVKVMTAEFSKWSDTFYVALDDGSVWSQGWSPEVEGRSPADWNPWVHKVYRGHYGPVASEARNTGGSFLATGGASDFKVNIWYRENETHPIYTLRTHSAAVTSVHFAHAGDTILTSSRDRLAEVWFLAAPIYTLAGGPISRIALSPDKKYIAAGTLSPQRSRAGGDVFVWDIHHDASSLSEWNRNPTDRLTDFNGSVYHLSYSPNGKYLVTCGSSGSVRMYNREQTAGSVVHSVSTFNGHDARYKVNCVVFSDDGSELLTASDDGTARLWDVQTCRELKKFTHNGLRVMSCAFVHSSSQILTTCVDGTTRLFERGGKQLLSMQPDGVRGWSPQAYPWSVECSRDSKMVLTGDGNGNAYLWNLKSGKPVAVLPYRHGQVFSATFSSDDRQIAVVGEGGYAEVWDTAATLLAGRSGATAAPKLSHRASAASLYACQFDQYNQSIFVGGEDDLIYRYPVTVPAMMREAHRIQYDARRITTAQR